MIKICKGNAVALLQMPEPSVPGHIREPLAPSVPEHDVRHECIVIRIASSKVKIEEPIVVNISKVTSHGKDKGIQAHLGRDF